MSGNIAFATVTWQANQSGNYTGEIIIPEGESITQYGEWWAEKVIVEENASIIVVPIMELQAQEH